jgi:hypothetical protein
MAAPRALAFVLVGLALTGCTRYLPKPEYSYVKTPAPIRVLPDGTRVDDRGYHLDAQGYRLDRNGEQLGAVDYNAKTDSSESSNAVAGYYISSTGEVATGTVARPSVGSRAGAGFGPGSAQPLPSGTEYAPVSNSTSNVPAGSNAGLSPSAPPTSSPATAPIPLAPPSR